MMSRLRGRRRKSGTKRQDSALKENWRQSMDPSFAEKWKLPTTERERLVSILSGVLTSHA
jgi:hypothetical protein